MEIRILKDRLFGIDCQKKEIARRLSENTLFPCPPS